MALATFTEVLTTCSDRGVKCVTLLGGEPTLYPYLDEAVELVVGLDMACRVVTNGQRAFRSFLNRHQFASKIHYAFSVDGSNPVSHDSTRGAGSFEQLLTSLQLANDLQLRRSAIVTVSRRNARDLSKILTLCHRYGMEYVNVHYMSNRGFGQADDVLPIDEWMSVWTSVQEYSRGLPGMDIRFEKTFEQSSEKIACAVAEGENVMFLPDGRVYRCMMFIDLPHSHSYNWSEGGMVQNLSSSSELRIVESSTLQTCPALELVNPKLAETIPTGTCATCIYKKSTVLNGGLV